MASPPPRDTTPEPVGWYVHLPFCPTKCGYCDFYSIPTRPEWIVDLTRAICDEITRRDPGRPVRSIFVGGGTPTVLPAEALEQILRCIPAHSAEPTLEFTVEANPSSADELKLDLLRRCGVNRVSFGAQSFHRDELAVLERLHDPAHVPAAVHLARQAGFDNVNLDLIFGIPGQTVRRWLDSLHRAIDLDVEHLACYGLMYEQGTALTKQRRLGHISPCDDDVEAEMYERTVDVLTAAGYEHYEISNFARPGRRCVHNMIYWRNEQYVGIGPSAVSFLDGVRSKNVPDVRRYIDGVQADRCIIVESERLNDQARACETAIQMLRLIDGIDLASYRRATGFDPLRLFASAIERFGPTGHLDITRDAIRLTRAGLLVANRIVAEFLEWPRAGSSVPIVR